MTLEFENAIAWAQVRSRGGPFAMLRIALVYAGFAIAALIIARQFAATDRDKHEVLSTAAIIVTFIQVIMMFLATGGAIAGAIRRDRASYQIESNRLMPLEPVQAILGYMLGAGAPVMLLCAVNLAIGSFVAAAGKLPISDWIAANGILALFCFSLWSVMAYSAFLPKGFAGVLMGILGSTAFTGGMIFALVPGLMAFFSPLQGKTIFMATSNSRLTTSILVAMAAQALISVLFIRMSARKYADENAVSFSPASGLLLLGIWTGLTWFGLNNYRQVHPLFIPGSRVDWRLTVVGAIASCMAVALAPLGAVAWSSAIRDWRRLDGNVVVARRWLFPLCLIICLIFILSPLSARMNELLVHPDKFTNPFGFRVPGPPPANVPILSLGAHPNPAMIATACAVYLIGAYLLMRLFYPAPRATGLVLFLTALAWFAPLLADVIYKAMETTGNEVGLNYFTLLSPVGTIWHALDNPKRDVWLGLAAQAAVVSAIFALFCFTRLRFQKRLRRRAELLRTELHLAPPSAIQPVSSPESPNLPPMSSQN